MTLEVSLLVLVSAWAGFLAGLCRGHRKSCNPNTPPAILMERAEGAEESGMLSTKITAGAKKLVRFVPLNKFGKPSSWDADNPLHVVANTGPATLVSVDVDYSGEPFPDSQVGQWFSLASNGSTVASHFELVGDGHIEGDGEVESIKPIAIILDVLAETADVESVSIEELPEVQE